MKRTFYTIMMTVQLEGDVVFTDLCVGNEGNAKEIFGVLFSEHTKAQQYLREMAFGAISEDVCRVFEGVCEEGEDGEDTIGIDSLGVKVNPDNVTVIYEDNEVTFFIKEIEIEM